MKTILVNALSVTNQSGRQFLKGHLRTLTEGLDGRRIVCLHHEANADLRAFLPARLEWRECPAWTAQWAGRAVWENTVLPGLARREGAVAYFTPAGVGVPRLPIPQVVFCQNPWALVASLHQTPVAKAKAAFQRAAYRRAVRQSAVMVYNSHFMAQAYAANAGMQAKREMIVYQGVDEGVFAAAAEWRTRAVPRIPGRIVCVSAMAPHKGVTTLLEAVALLRRERVPGVSLDLIGGWPDSTYRHRVEAAIDQFDLRGCVELHGHVTEERLHQAYAEARVFALLSECESFGFPAVEAHAFGTPSVCADSTAMPEIQGEGGAYVPPGDVASAASAIGDVLADDVLWEERSKAARANAGRFHWEQCSPPLLQAFEGL